MKTKIILRKKGLPALYTWLSWVRRHNISFVDCAEDMEMIRQLQQISRGEICLSDWDRYNDFKVAIGIDDSILELSGKTDEVWRISIFHIKPVDVMYSLQGDKPAEAISLSDAGIDINRFKNLGMPWHCLDYLERYCFEFFEETNNGLRRQIPAKEYLGISEEEYRQLKQKDKSAVRLAKNLLKEMKLRDSKPFYMKYKPLGKNLKFKILGRDSFTCFFCGKKRTDHPELETEVEHLIPRTIIERLDLPKHLETDEYNLTAICDGCNIGKSGNLTKNNVVYMLEKISDKKHPNYQLTKYLMDIQKTQTNQ